jgi:serine/threonine-protein kinase
MDPDGFARVQKIFDEVSELPEAERRAFLDKACAGDEQVRREVESLLAADHESGGFLEQSPTPQGLDLSSLVGKTGRPRAGPYKLLRKIGEGGMSEVFLAVRADDEYQKRVAVKIIRHDMDREDLVRRFRTERQILAGLDHPNIARLLDGGTTDEGLPYFVMDYIDGIPIHQHCDDHRLSVAERLRLFRSVCSAVQYAHQNLVVHRDIKASNILVDASGDPKLLDFGIAKLLKPDQFAGQVDYTATWMRPMTPRYASPEQVQGKPITTSSDVYSLGVLLYRLLTGHLPYRFEGEDPSEWWRVVVEQEPERPSTSVSRVETDPGPSQVEITPNLVSHTRRTQPHQLRRLLAGDLDNILLMALRKESQRRYGSVEQFSDDIGRYLDKLPVAARPDTLGYRTGKFLRRNRWAVAAAASFVLVLFAFAMSMAFQAQRVAEERDQARRQRDRAEQVVGFLEEIFDVSDPFSPDGEVITAREVLERGAERIRSELAGEPETRATLMNSIGRVYAGLGLYDRAEPLVREALETRVELLPGDDPLVAESRDTLGSLLRDRGALEDAEPLLRQALEQRIRIFGEEHLAVARSSHSLAKLLQDQARYDEAKELYAEALGIHERAGGDVIERSMMQINLAALLNETGEEAAAEAGFREVLRVRKQALGDDHALVAEALNDLGVFYGIRGDFESSEPLLRQGLETRKRALGEQHHSVAEGMNNLGMLLKQKGELDEAEALYRGALVIMRDRLGGEHPSVAIQMHNLARLLQAEGEYLQAEKLHRETLDIRRRVLGNSHNLTALSLTGLGAVLIDVGRPAEAEALLREALQVYEASLPPGHWRNAEARSFLGQCLADTSRDAEAELHLVAGYDGLHENRGANHPRTRGALQRHIDFYESRGRSDQVADYRVRLQD